MGMKYRDPSTGQFKDLKVKTSDTLPIGTQVAYGGTVPPTGWLICDGSAVSRTTYAELFKVIGTSYGAGDGSTTFNLPNKKGRVSAGYDSTNSKFNAIGKKLGEETHTLTVAELAEHNHGKTPIDIAIPKLEWTTTAANLYTLNNEQGYPIGELVAVGGNQPHNNIQPTEVDNWIIKAFQSIGVVGKVVNTKTNSDNDTYSCNYINKIIETGYGNGVYYTKYANGKLVQSFNQNITCNETRLSGGLSYYSGSAEVNLPIAFKDTNYRCSSNINMANMNYFANSYISINSESVVNVSLATTENNATRIVNVNLTGEWK